MDLCRLFFRTGVGPVGNEQKYIKLDVSSIQLQHLKRITVLQGGK